MNDKRITQQELNDMPKETWHDFLNGIHWDAWRTLNGDGTKQVKIEQAPVTLPSRTVIEQPRGFFAKLLGK